MQERKLRTDLERITLCFTAVIRGLPTHFWPNI